jgi:hypothetical protein
LPQNCFTAQRKESSRRPHCDLERSDFKMIILCGDAACPSVLWY